MFTLCYPVLESSRTSRRPRESSRTILKPLVLALALRVESLALALRLVLDSITVYNVCTVNVLTENLVEDNFEVLGLGLGLESRVLGLGLEACVLDSITVYNVCTVNVLTENLDANNFSDHSRPFPERKVVFPRGGRGGAPYNFDSLRNSFPILHAARTRPPLWPTLKIAPADIDPSISIQIRQRMNRTNDIKHNRTHWSINNTGPCSDNSIQQTHADRYTGRSVLTDTVNFITSN